MTFTKNLEKNFGENVKILDSRNSYKGSVFNKHDLIIVDDFSTAFYELLFYKKPFIVLNSAPNVNYNKKFWMAINELKKLIYGLRTKKELSRYLDKNLKKIIFKRSKNNQVKTFIKN